MSLLQENCFGIDFLVVIAPFYLLFDVVVHPDNTICAENSPILVNVIPKIRIKDQLISSSKFITFWDVTRGKGSKTKDDKMWHGGRGSKISIFLLTNFLNGR